MKRQLLIIAGSWPTEGPWTGKESAARSREGFPMQTISDDGSAINQKHIFFGQSDLFWIILCENNC